MKKATCITALILLAVASAADAEEKKDLGITFDLTYTSKWMSKGVEAYGSKGGLFKTVDFDFWGTGFGTKVTHRNATSSGYVNSERNDYRPYFKSLLFEDTPGQLNYNISVGYEHYLDHPRKLANTTWEWIFAFSWPNLFGGKVVPSYIAHYEYPASNNRQFRDLTGWVHRFLLARDVDCSALQAPLHVTGEVAYYDGLGGRGSDWAYATFGVSTKLDINKKTAFVPGVYHQVSMDDAVCKKDVTYTMLSLKHRFK